MDAIQDMERPVTEERDAAVEFDPAEEAAVRKWTSKIKSAKHRWKDSFDNMKADREFCFGRQWQDQKHDDDRYLNNMVIAAVNQKVATYYARNPKAVFQRRPRLDFELWDGNIESLAQAVNAVGMFKMGVAPPDIRSMALLQDFINGRQRQEKVQKVGKTLEMVYQWCIDQQEPEFKKQMKSLVRRVCICGVGYVKLHFVREYETTPDVPLTVSDIRLRAGKVQALLEKLGEGELDESDPKMDELRSTLQSMLYSVHSGELTGIQEQIVLSFPKSSSIIPDKDCTCLKDFVGAQFIAEERILPLSFVKEYYEVPDIMGLKDEIVSYTRQGEEFINLDPHGSVEGTPDAPEKLVCVWEVWNKTNKTRFTICNGWRKYLVKPEPVTPLTHRFWEHFALTFNDTEYEIGDKASIFPPSDVRLMRSAQREYNRSREALREHRKGNAPRWGARAGVLDARDKDRLSSCLPHETVELKIPDNQGVADVLMPIPKVPIDEREYLTDHLERDVELAVGVQQANMGPAQPNVTATVGSIAEQSRMTRSSSNVDDLDDMLSDLARSAGEIIIRAFSPQTVQRIVGFGLLPPDAEKEGFLNEVFLEVQAASSGRPNKGVEMANMRELMPLLIQAGANPQFLVEEMLTRWDDRLDITRAFPLVPPMLGPGPGGPQPPPQAGPGQPGKGERQVPPRPTRPGVDTKQRSAGPQ